jgi:hypothetical protein
MDYTNIPSQNWSSLHHNQTPDCQVFENNAQENTPSMPNARTQLRSPSIFAYEGPSTAYTFSPSHASSPEKLARWYEQRLQERKYISQCVLGFWLIRNSYFQRIHSSRGAKSGELWRWDNSQWPGSRSRTLLVHVWFLVPGIGMARTRSWKFVKS